METKETTPINWSSDTCSKYLESAPCIRVEVNILPLIEELNRTSRNFYATKKDKNNVLNNYVDWISKEDFPTVSYFEESDLPSPSRLSSTLEMDRTNDVFTRVFWLTRNGWKMEVEESFDSKARLARQKYQAKLDARKDVDLEGNYIDFSPKEKLVSGKDFRKRHTGLRIFDWIVPTSELGQPDEMDSDHGHDWEPEHEPLATTPPSRNVHNPDGDALKKPIPPIDTNNLIPNDSVSHADRHNFRTDRAAQGWDDDTSIGELGWDVPKKKGEIVNSGNAEVGLKTASPWPEKIGDEDQCEQWQVVTKKKGKGKGRGNGDWWKT